MNKSILILVTAIVLATISYLFNNVYPSQDDKWDERLYANTGPDIPMEAYSGTNNKEPSGWKDNPYVYLQSCSYTCTYIFPRKDRRSIMDSLLDIKRKSTNLPSCKSIIYFIS